MNRETSKAYAFHGWRHFYTSYMRKKVDEKLLQKQTGHKTLTMLNRKKIRILLVKRGNISEAELARRLSMSTTNTL